MKTCFTCANSIDPNSDLGRRRSKRVHDHETYHPLVHFAICGRRNVWLDVARTNCHNWSHPHHHPANDAHPAATPKLRTIADVARRHRHRVAMAAYSALMVVATFATYLVQK